MFGIVAFLSERNGWSIEYIMELTWYQLDCLLKGIKQISAIRNKSAKEEKEKINKKKSGTPEITDAMQLISLPGFKISAEAKEKLINIMKNKQQKSGNKNG